MAAHQALPSLGFSRQEHWSGLPFPSPMHESEKWKVKVKFLSRVRLLATPWTAAHLAPLFIGFSRQEYWSGVPLPSPTSSYRYAQNSTHLASTWTPSHAHLKNIFNFVKGLVNNLMSSTLMVYSCLENLMDRGACPWKSPGKNTGVGGHSLLQGIFLTQEWNLGLLNWQADSLPLCHLGRLLKILAQYIL